MASGGELTGREERLKALRRGLPDGPGVYFFKDGSGGEVLYVGKARSIRKRVASHFSNPVTRGDVEMVALAQDIEVLLLASDAEALLAENRLIKRHQPRFNIRLRDDKSYPYVAISMDEDFPRVYFTRERHRRNRLYFGPYSNAKRTRATLDVLGKVFQVRSCQGAEPGRRTGSPCLDFHIDRCGAPCVGYVTKEEYREAVDGVIAFLSGRYKEVEATIEARMAAAAAAQEYEQAARERNRLRAMRSLLERQRIVNDAVGTLDAIALAVDGTDANAQVFQLRDGVLADRQSFYLENAGGLGLGQAARRVHRAVLRRPPVGPGAGDRPAGRSTRTTARSLGAGARRAPRRPGRGARGRARRQAPDPRAGRAQRAAGARHRAPEGRAQPPAARRGARRAAGGAAAWTCCRCGSSATTSRR